MRISTLGYVGRQGFKNIWRNKMFSLASVATMTACIFLFGLFLSIVLNLRYMVRTAEEGVAITVFFDEGLSDREIEEIGEKLESRPEVSEVVFVSAEEAWENFSQNYFAENPELAEGFRNDNPLADSASYEVYMKSGAEDAADLTDGITGQEQDLAETQQSLVAFAESLDGVRDVNRSDVVAEVFSNVSRLVTYVSIAIIAILLIVSIFLISNTVTMGITVRKEEIAIMKYIGAKDFVVRSPFVIEGLIIGILGAIIPLTILYFAYERVVAFILDRFSILDNIISFLSVQEVYKTLLPVGILLGIGIGFVGSFFTVRKHLKV